MNNLLDFVEDLQPHKGIEHQCLELPVFILFSIIIEKLVSSEIQSQRNGKLANGLANDHLGHPQCDERSRLAIWHSVENASSRRVCRKSERSKCVHDEIHPEKLHSVKYRLLSTTGNGRDESQDNGRNVYRQLKLGDIG